MLFLSYGPGWQLKKERKELIQTAKNRIFDQSSLQSDQQNADKTSQKVTLLDTK